MTKGLPLRIALSQPREVPADHRAAEMLVERDAGRAAANGAAIVVFPELFWCGYGPTEKVHRMALSRAEARSRFGAIADAAGISILMGYAERGEDGNIYNSALMVDARGQDILSYRKMHLWGDFETGCFTPGAPGPVVPVAAGLRAGVLICFDLDFPECARDLARRGADMILVISATSHPYTVVPGAVVPARAYENAVFLAFCNQTGQQAGGDFLGLSTIAAPDGSILVRAAQGDADLVFGDIDPQHFAAYRAAHDYHAQLRADLFHENPRSTDSE